jgi:hypothetical protein
LTRGEGKNFLIKVYFLLPNPLILLQKPKVKPWTELAFSAERENAASIQSLFDRDASRSRPNFASLLFFSFFWLFYICDFWFLVRIYIMERIELCQRALAY